MLSVPLIRIENVYLFLSSGVPQILESGLRERSKAEAQSLLIHRIFLWVSVITSLT